jgi:signal peptidase I
MLPAYENGDQVLVSRLAFAGKKGPQQGDVILMKNKIYAVSGENTVMLKRVIGVEGDRILITEGQVYVNNQKLDEEYVFTQGISGDMEEIQIPAGKIFVMGDNRNNSSDSRDPSVGNIHRKDIIGRAFIRIWPSSKFGILKHQ